MKQIFSLLAILVSVAAIIGLWWFVSQGSATISSVERLTFYDDKRGTSFTLVVNPSSTQFGQFIFAVSGLGQYQGGSADAIQILPDGRISLHYQGHATLISSNDGTNVPASVALNANINPLRTNATITLSENKMNRQFQVVALPPQGKPEAVVTEYTAAIENSDFSTLYELTSQTTKGNLSQEEFEQLLNEQITQEGNIVNIEDLSNPQIETNAAGLIFFTVDQRVTIEKDGLQSTQDFTSVFLSEEEEWRFWFAEPKE